MPTLYVANLTKQRHIFNFIAPGYSPATPGAPRFVMIQPGTQEKIAEANEVADLEGIIKHHRTYGMRSVQEVIRAEKDETVPLCFSIDKPIPVEAIMGGILRTDEVLERRSETAMELTTLGTRESISEKLRPLGGEVTAFENSFTDQNRKGPDGRSATATIEAVTDPSVPPREVREARARDGGAPRKSRRRR